MYRAINPVPASLIPWTLVSRAVATRIAALVYKQERAEGNLRFSHLRLRANAAEVALYAGSLPESAALEEALSTALQNQGIIVNMHWLLAANTRALEYAGALLNYCCIAFAIFYGASPMLFPCIHFNGIKWSRSMAAHSIQRN
jgi:ABC-type uncharacterized transport system fused permease/ATPase subunit